MGEIDRSEWRRFGRPLGRRTGWDARRSTRDAVTGLMNASAFQVVAAHALSRCLRVGEPSVLLCCALGDEEPEGEVARARRLREVAGGLVTATRGEDVLGRTGPFELCALLPGAADDDAGLVATRLRALEAAVGWKGTAAGAVDLQQLLADARTRARAEAISTLKVG